MTEVTENEVQTISLNDKEYKVDELSDKAKYLVSQVQDMQTQANQTRAKLDQIEVGIRGFTGLLQEELENPAPTESPAEGEVVN
jgi:chromosome segregation ATPase